VVTTDHGLTVEFECASENPTPVLQKFQHNRGPLLLRTALDKAGVKTGRFVYRIIDSFKTRGLTKPVQVRRHDATAVHVWLKPGDNGSGVKGVLMVDRDEGPNTPESVYNALRGYTTATYGRRTEAVVPTGPTVNDATAELLILAVNDANTKHHATLADFENAVLDALRGVSFEPELEQLNLMLLELGHRGWILDHGSYFAVTPEGQAWADNPTRPATEAPKVPAGSPGKPAPPAADPNDAVELLRTQSGKLARLMALPNLIAQSRVRQQELRTQIDTLKAQLDAEEGVELGLREEIDEGAVRRLLGGAA